MNGAAYFVLILIACSRIFMVLAWILRYHRRAFSMSRVELSARVLVLVLWAAGLIVIPVVAHPGDQPGWTDAFQFVLFFPVVFGAADLSTRRKQSRQ